MILNAEVYNIKNIVFSFANLCMNCISYVYLYKLVNYIINKLGNVMSLI